MYLPDDKYAEITAIFDGIHNRLTEALDDPIHAFNIVRELIVDVERGRKTMESVVELEPADKDRLQDTPRVGIVTDTAREAWDRFAAAAIQGELAAGVLPKNWKETMANAALCANIADAMMRSGASRTTPSVLKKTTRSTNT